MNQTICLALDRIHDLGMAVPHKGHAEPRCKIDVSVAIRIDDVCASSLDPNDGIMGRSAPFFASLTPSRERGAFASREAPYP